MLGRGASRLRWHLQRLVGFFVLRRWPWPLWKLRGEADLPIGSSTFRFLGVDDPRQLWWAHMARQGRWEPEVIRELQRALQPGDVFFDLGAFTGAYTLLASRAVGPTGRVVAFEPDAIARAALERNIAANDAHNVAVVPFAVGGYEGTVTFSASGDSVGHLAAEGVEVRQVTLDGFCDGEGIRPTVMKVDIEGGEAAALEESVVVRDVRELVLEIHEPELRERGADPAGLLERLGPHRLLEPPETGNYAVTITPARGH